MTAGPVYIAGIGIVSSLGSGLAATRQALAANRSGIKPLTLFELLQGSPLPVGQAVELPGPPEGLPRTHQLACSAALQAMTDCPKPPEAVIIGTTTGGILTTETLLRSDEQDAARYRYHGLSTVTEAVARSVNCVGPALTVSTACSSGAVAITLAMRLLQRGAMERILVGGADCLCRLTYFGFHSLQLVDRTGCRPLDLDRQGMSVAEGAALLLLTRQKPAYPCGAVLTGAGLSCDAYHPASPHPDGDGALRAMQAALADAGLQPGDIDYLNLHGTGTPDNDLAEAKAVRRLFSVPPPLSSIKGATGHSLAASGAIEAVVATIAISEGLLPATTGCRLPDPALDLQPIRSPLRQPVTTVLSNSFGFGGNNCCLVVQVPGPERSARTSPVPKEPDKRLLALHGWSCLTGAGDLQATLDRLQAGHTVAGQADLTALSANLPPRLIRRLKRLPRLALSLATAAVNRPSVTPPTAIYLGTGWGALSETHDFLKRLADSAEQFPSPTDFVGSVHNAAAGQVAQLLRATGANVTSSGGDYSFEQALLTADLLLENTDQTALVLGVDEGHQVLSPRFDPSIVTGSPLADGGGAFVVGRAQPEAPLRVRAPFYRSSSSDNLVSALLAWCGGRQAVDAGCGLILAGIPHDSRHLGEEQLAAFLALLGAAPPVTRYRSLVGEFASASAVAAVLAAALLQDGTLPRTLTNRPNAPLAGKSVLVLGLGTCLTAMEFSRS